LRAKTPSVKCTRGSSGANLSAACSTPPICSSNFCTSGSFGLMRAAAITASTSGGFDASVFPSSQRAAVHAP
jgi:hypothetical protein